jgi:histidine triad (HIT) family protein
MAYDEDNIFAKILRGEFTCIKIYEDDLCLSIMDVMPQTEGHILVIPKESAVMLLDLSDDSAAHCIKTVKRLAPAVMKATGKDGITILQLNGEKAGQSVPHIHFHLIPGSILEAKGHAREIVALEQLQPVADRIIACL